MLDIFINTAILILFVSALIDFYLWVSIGFKVPAFTITILSLIIVILLIVIKELL